MVQRLRIFMIVATILLALIVAIGLLWSWAVALALLFGGALCTLCFFVTYHSRAVSLLNNLADTQQRAFTALISNREARQDAAASGAVQDTFTPFSFRDRILSEAEDARARALLRQVFPTEEDFSKKIE